MPTRGGLFTRDRGRDADRGLRIVPSIDVNVPGGSYTITIEPGALARLGAIVAAVAPNPRAFLAPDLKITATHGLAAADSLRAAGYELAELGLDAGEYSKSLGTVRRLYHAMIDGRLERGSPVVAIGGGVIGDTAGFAAATYMRGLPLIQAPTTLLAMVDAAIGGKTAVNLALSPEEGGPHGRLIKNLIGAFWQPRAVVADPLVLGSLAERELRCGLAECVKHAILADEGLLVFIHANLALIMQRDPAALTELIHRSARVKVAIVQEDERESGRRALLNLGHTFGHVIEPMAEQQLKHGEAVAIGLRAAAGCAVAMGRIDQGDLDRLTDVLTRIGLPTRMRQPVALDKLIEAMGYDKKVAGGRLRLILPSRGGGAEIVEDVSREMIEAGWKTVRPQG